MAKSLNYNEKLAALEFPTLVKKPRLTRVNFIRIGLAIILFIICIGALPYAFQGKPMMYLFFVTICGIGSFVAMVTTWSD